MTHKSKIQAMNIIFFRNAEGRTKIDKTRKVILGEEVGAQIHEKSKKRTHYNGLVMQKQGHNKIPTRTHSDFHEI
jgi:hypothetical protein